MSKVGLCLLILILVILLILGWCWFGSCPFCPDCPICPTPPAPAATLVLEDMHTAAWGPLDNGFIPNSGIGLGTTSICKADSPSDEQKFGKCAGGYTDPVQETRPGVLFQIGHVDRGAGGKEDNFDNVVLTRSSGPAVTLTDKDFEWLDVNAAGAKCALDALHAYSMFLDPNKLTTTQCDGATLEPPMTPLTCLRGRAIQAGFLPDTAIVTYWPGAGDYELAMSDMSHDFGYTFKLQDAVTVDRWFEGCFQERYDDVTEIRIRYIHDSTHHQGFPHQPMDGGTISVTAY